MSPLLAIALGAASIGALGYAMLRYLDGPKRPTPEEQKRRKYERSRSLYWLCVERNKRRDIEFYAMELELELEQYRSEERAKEARVWKWN